MSNTNTTIGFVVNNPNEIFYLYINLPPQGNLHESLLPKLKKLADTEFQDQLDHNGFKKLPDVYRNIWRVKLGLTPPKIFGRIFIKLKELNRAPLRKIIIQIYFFAVKNCFVVKLFYGFYVTLGLSCYSAWRLNFTK